MAELLGAAVSLAAMAVLVTLALLAISIVVLAGLGTMVAVTALERRSHRRTIGGRTIGDRPAPGIRTLTTPRSPQ
ncbi:hypothetical protein [Sphaerimonospora thailandensis]|uniref:Uncharacterized protein n=1 Tax=Sphaerimonospora thailandensis TaxID=795644 RepID=A0A8J3VY21_9ACTN|nr:hypothetical protein [Sphaerimonospora thailandensis]GIH68510.1 hypothetical protein Mth01_07630 [Sphaerimonospora thailandensis]